MCGRIALHTPPSRLARLLHAQLAADVDPDAPPSWNVAPSTDVITLMERKDHERRLVALRWGLVPFWAKDPSVGSKMVNARAESLERRPAFRRLLSGHRCLVVADGFYEWRPVPGPRRKQPYYFTRADGAPLTLAGLWDGWRPPGTEDDARHPPALLRTCTIVTTAAGPDVAFAHDRMPVVVESDAVDRWLDSDHDAGAVGDLLAPSPGGILVSHPVGPRVSRVENDGPDLIAPVPAEDSTDEAPRGAPSPSSPRSGKAAHDQGRGGAQPSLF